MKSGAWWPVAIIGVLGVTVAANALLLYEASDPNADAIEPDYYRKAVAWDSTLADEARSRALGWSADADLAPAADGAEVVVRLADAASEPLEGAAVTLAAIHNRGQGRFVTGDLVPRGGGRYTATLPLDHFGLWELRLSVRRDADTFGTTLRRELPRAAPGARRGTEHGHP